MTHCDRRKKRFGALMITITITALLSAAIIVALTGAAYYGISKDLCARNLSPSLYKEMKLDCREYGYDRQ
jgi:hypothetical protein